MPWNNLILWNESIKKALWVCSVSLQVLERDLAIFGFFIALGRRTQIFLCANGFGDIGDPLESFIRYNYSHFNISCFFERFLGYHWCVLCCRYLIGGSVLFYPQLSAISSYQLYVEVSIYFSDLSDCAWILKFANLRFLLFLFHRWYVKSWIGFLSILAWQEIRNCHMVIKVNKIILQTLKLSVWCWMYLFIGCRASLNIVNGWKTPQMSRQWDLYLEGAEIMFL